MRRLRREPVPCSSLDLEHRSLVLSKADLGKTIERGLEREGGAVAPVLVHTMGQSGRRLKIGPRKYTGRNQVPIRTTDSWTQQEKRRRYQDQRERRLTLWHSRLFRQINKGTGYSKLGKWSRLIERLLMSQNTKRDITYPVTTAIFPSSAKLLIVGVSFDKTLLSNGCASLPSSLVRESTTGWDRSTCRVVLDVVPSWVTTGTWSCLVCRSHWEVQRPRERVRRVPLVGRINLSTRVDFMFTEGPQQVKQMDMLLKTWMLGKILKCQSKVAMACLIQEP